MRSNANCSLEPSVSGDGEGEGKSGDSGDSRSSSGADSTAGYATTLLSLGAGVMAMVGGTSLLTAEHAMAFLRRLRENK